MANNMVQFTLEKKNEMLIFFFFLIKKFSSDETPTGKGPTWRPTQVQDSFFTSKHQKHGS